MNYVLCFLAFLFLVELVYFRIAEHFHIVDRPNSRSSHSRPTLRGGGIVIPIGVCLSVLLFRSWWCPPFALGLLLVSAVSFWDDVHSLPGRWRLLVQLLAVGVLLCALVPPLSLSFLWIFPLALFVGVGLLNACNFMDGINGMTALYGFSVLIPLSVCYASGFGFPDLIQDTALCLLVFSFFNCRPKARCFAGDVGAVSLGFVLLSITARLALAEETPVYLLFFAVYGVDTALTILHRIQLHEPLGQAHRKHAYQLLANELHWPHLLVAFLYASLQLIISMGMLHLPHGRGWYALGVICLLCIVYVLFMKKYYPLHEATLRAGSGAEKK